MSYEKYIMDMIRKHCRGCKRHGLNGNAVARNLACAIVDAINEELIETDFEFNEVKKERPICCENDGRFDRVLRWVNDFATFAVNRGSRTDWLRSMETERNLDGKIFEVEIHRLPNKLQEQEPDESSGDDLISRYALLEIFRELKNKYPREYVTNDGDDLYLCEVKRKRNRTYYPLRVPLSCTSSCTS